MANELAQITKLESALAKAKTQTEVKGVMDQAEAIAHAAKRWGAARVVIVQALWVFVDAYVRLGEMLGPHPGKRGEGKKKVNTETPFSKEREYRARAITHRVPKQHREAYRKWTTSAEMWLPSVKDLFVLSRCPKDIQRKAIKLLVDGKAKNLAEAIRYVKRKMIEEGETSVPKGKFRCLIVDPPWPIDSAGLWEMEASPAELTYKTMSIEEIAAYPIPAHDECHLFLWTTQRFLPDCFAILKAWKFNYGFTMVWRKSGGMQPFGGPAFNCEFVIFARRGGLEFLDTKDFKCCFDGKRRAHSQKPVEFYDIVRRVSPKPRIDLFSRERVDGFKQGGKQVDAL